MTIASTDPSTPEFDQRKRLLAVQVGATLIGVSLLFTKPAIVEGTIGRLVIEVAGLGLVLACVVGRLWSILYIGGRKNDEVISIGPFSMTRNPLYFCSTLGATGLGLAFGSLTIAAVLGLSSYLIFRVTAEREAAHLLAKFGDTYRDYARRTPRFWPNPFLYRDKENWRFSPPALNKTFRDGLCFLAIYGLVEFIAYFRLTDYLPTIAVLY